MLTYTYRSLFPILEPILFYPVNYFSLSERLRLKIIRFIKSAGVYTSFGRDLLKKASLSLSLSADKKSSGGVGNERPEVKRRG